MLSKLLEDALAQFDPAEALVRDPVEIVWGYEDPRDQEVAALVQSGLAYGRVELVRDAGRRALAPLGAQPARSLARLSPERLSSLYEGYVYRMTTGPDLVDLFLGIARALREHGSLEGAYLAGSGATHLERASHFVQLVRAGRRRKALARGLRYLLPDPADGSTCKRLHLFFRWMVRGPDGIDLGLWPQVSPADLLMPLDTHTSRICRYLGMTARESTDGIAALEVTRALQALCPQDPLKYDFALCHLGISGRCIHRYSPVHCPSCPIASVCLLRARGEAAALAEGARRG